MRTEGEPSILPFIFRRIPLNPGYLTSAAPKSAGKRSRRSSRKASNWSRGACDMSSQEIVRRRIISRKSSIILLFLSAIKNLHAYPVVFGGSLPRREKCALHLRVAAGTPRLSLFSAAVRLPAHSGSAKKKAKSGRRTRSIRHRSRRQAGEAARLFRIMPCVTYYADSYHVLRITQFPVMHYVLRSFLSYITYYAVSCHALRITQFPVMRQVKSMLSTSWSFFGS